jgi:hypothetical protein
MRTSEVSAVNIGVVKLGCVNRRTSKIYISQVRSVEVYGLNA